MFTGVALMGSYFNVCSIVDETVSEGLGGVALLEVSHWEWALRIQKLIPCFPTTHPASNWWLKWSPQSLPQHHASLPAAMFPKMMVTL